MIEIPIQINEFFEHEAQYRIDGVWFGFKVYYNKRIGVYYLDIEDSDGVIVKSSIPLFSKSIINVDLFTKLLFTVPFDGGGNVPGVGFKLLYEGD